MSLNKKELLDVVSKFIDTMPDEQRLALKPYLEHINSDDKYLIAALDHALMELMGVRNAINAENLQWDGSTCG